MDQDPFFLELLDIRKAYYNLEIGHIPKTLTGYGAGSKLQVLLE